MLELRGIAKSYEGRPLLTDVSFRVEQGERVCLLGPSGSGKSTLLLILAGLENAEAGTVLWQGADLLKVPAHRRDFGIVFQDYALFPHLDVGSNVAFGLQTRGWQPERSSRRVAEVLESVNLPGFQTRRIADLSGGEQQRVALARALAPRPRLLMLDEPLSALDRTLREELRSELRRILQESGLPAIYVTHDQEEAFALGDRALILHDGRIVCQGSPEQVVSHPGSSWAATFLGLGAVLHGTATRAQDGSIEVETICGSIEVEGISADVSGRDVSLLIRPDRVRMGELRRGLSLDVRDVVYQREGYRVTLQGGIYLFAPAAPRIGDTISVEIDPAEILPEG